MTRIVILQPSYLPWIGYFNQIIKSDYFVYLDDVLYTKNDWRNRNRIKTSNGIEWLTVPVEDKNRLKNKLLIKDIKIKDLAILDKHLKSLELNYKRANYYDEFYPVVSRFYKKNWVYLSELNIKFIYLVLKYLNVDNKKLLKSSDLKIEFTNSTDRLIKICKTLNATNYLTGDSAKNYLDEKIFKKNNIILEYHNYKHPIYNQLWGKFTPYLSIVDLLFNEGKKSLKYLK